MCPRLFPSPYVARCVALGHRHRFTATEKQSFENRCNLIAPGEHNATHGLAKHELAKAVVAMTLKLFHSDAYRRQFRATVKRLQDESVVLDRTCFMHATATRAGDLGHLAGFAVSEVVWDDETGATVHRLDELRCGMLQEGEVVTGEIDWGRRHRLMQTESARHLTMSGIGLTHELGQIVGETISPSRATVRIATETETPESHEEGWALQQWVNNIVSEDVPIVSRLNRSLDGRRFWHIDGIGSIASESPHVRSTAEIGPVQIRLTGAAKHLEVQIELGNEAPA